ncbi:MAG: hypothetical protein QNK84_08120 [Flavobacteriales bacterium]|jgi:hypothetical protein|tara:strand:+ start:1419 stop:1628 length:210 start_codon:yes stop_codon:yes gene_type:complete
MKKIRQKSKEMLVYSKNVLNKMSFDVFLFKKELTKACKNLSTEEVDELMKWVLENFGAQYVLQPILVKK